MMSWCTLEHAACDDAFRFSICYPTEKRHAVEVRKLSADLPLIYLTYPASYHFCLYI